MTSLTCSAEDVIQQWKVDDCVNIRNVRWRTRLTPHWPRFVARSLTQTTAWSWLVGFANCGSCAKTRLSVKVSLSIGTCVFESLIAKVLTLTSGRLSPVDDIQHSDHQVGPLHKPEHWIGLCSVLRPRQHSIGYMADGFYRSKDPTNSIKVLKEDLQKRKKTTKTTKYRYT